jgi:hypothetical protein
MTRIDPKPRRHAWLVTLLTFASLVFAVVAFMTPFNLIFGPLAIVSGVVGLILNRAVRGDHDGQP